MEPMQAARPFAVLSNHFESCEAVNPETRETASALSEALRSLGELAVDAQAVILNKPAELWLEAHENGASESDPAIQALQQLETCRIGTCQGIIFDVNSLQVSVSQLDRLGGEDGARRSQSLVEPTLNTIRDDLALLHFCTIARAGMLCAEDNIDACLDVLREYAAFLGQTIIPNADLLERLAVDGNAWKNLGEAATAFAGAIAR